MLVSEGVNPLILSLSFFQPFRDVALAMHEAIKLHSPHPNTVCVLIGKQRDAKQLSLPWIISCLNI